MAATKCNSGRRRPISPEVVVAFRLTVAVLLRFDIMPEFQSDRTCKWFWNGNAPMRTVMLMHAKRSRYKVTCFINIHTINTYQETRKQTSERNDAAQFL